jgi:metallo-beta-lactamase class B
MQHKIICCLVVLSLCFVSVSIPTWSAPVQLPGEESNQPFKPFRIIGNINYVGTNDLACYLITTSAGLILIDTGLPESPPLVRANIAALGFKLQDIKIILSSHAHYDHVGGHAEMKQDTGAKVYASTGDAPLLESGGTTAFFPIKSFKPVKVDRVVKDGETIQLGDVKLTAHLTPGHTEGNTTWTMVTTEKGKTYDVVFAASMSINTGVHLVNFPPWPNIAEVYAKSFQVLKGLHCDVFLGPHGRFFNLQAKVQKMNADPSSNPFIDPKGYRDYVASFEQLYNQQLQLEKASR